MAGQITVNLDALKAQEKDLDDLLNRLTSRQLNVNISVSKGAIADGPRQAAEYFKGVSLNLVDLVTKTRNGVRNIRISFSDADQSVADYFNSSEG